MIERAQRAVAAENGVELDYSQAEVLKPQEMLRQFDEVNICGALHLLCSSSSAARG